MKTLITILALSSLAFGQMAYSPGKLSTPVASPVAGSYSGTQSVTYTLDAAGTKTCYTTDGVTQPAINTATGNCSAGTAYTTAISVASTETLKACTFAPYWQASSCSSDTYTISAGNTPWILTITPGSDRSNFTGCVGGPFTTQSGQTPTVKELCRWKLSGNSGSHKLVLLDGATGTSVLASTTVDMSTGSANSFVCGSVTPYTTAASTQYFVLSVETSGADHFLDDDTVIATSNGDQVYSNGSTFVTDGTSANSCATGNAGAHLTSPHIYVPVNIKY